MHMVYEMEKKGCPVTDSFFKCKPCGVQAYGFYSSKLGVVLCEDHLPNHKEREAMARHELVHAYDYCTKELNMNNCVHIACSEIRASNLSGECNPTVKLTLTTKLESQHWHCVKRRAQLSVSIIPQCKESAEQAVKMAWPYCSRDSDPFEYIP